ncbi:MAG: peptide deformylase [Kiritimatiellae bacterium]|nr:peptide deformylase [Kiritimatiellia bacterium]
MILPIRKYGDPVLREPARPVGCITPEIVQLAQDMLETMHKAKGVGIAAEQVGRLERICVIDIPDGCDKGEQAAFNAPIPMPLAMVNPEIISLEGSENDKEGCLSFPGIGGSVVRAAKVVCTYIDLAGRRQTISAAGFLARAIQHETDHLDGRLYVDRMSAVERLAFAPKLKKLSRANGGVR